MKRELISTNRSLIAKTKNQGHRKIILFKQAKDFCEQYIKVTDLDKFAESFRNYLYDGLKEKSKGSLDSVGYSNLILLYDINDEQLKRVEIEFKKLANVKLNKTYTEIETFDAGIYAETPEELKKLEQYRELERFVEKLKKANVPVNYSHLSRAFHPLTNINISELEPNINYIKNIRF